MHCYLCSTVAENLFTWDGAALITSMMAIYNIDFVSIIIYNLFERTFDHMTTLPFYCLVLLLCDEAGVLEIPRVNHRFKGIGVIYTHMIKDTENPVLSQRSYMPSIVITAWSKGLPMQSRVTDRVKMWIQVWFLDKGPDRGP